MNSICTTCVCGPNICCRSGYDSVLSGPSLMCVYGEVGSGKSTLSASLATIAEEKRVQAKMTEAGKV
jgi:hypothetical protein